MTLIEFDQSILKHKTKSSLINASPTETRQKGEKLDQNKSFIVIADPHTNSCMVPDLRKRSIYIAFKIDQVHEVITEQKKERG